MPQIFDFLFIYGKHYILLYVIGIWHANISSILRFHSSSAGSISSSSPGISFGWWHILNLVSEDKTYVALWEYTATRLVVAGSPAGQFTPVKWCRDMVLVSLTEYIGYLSKNGVKTWIHGLIFFSAVVNVFQCDLLYWKWLGNEMTRRLIEENSGFSLGSFNK